jgi:Tfp pilus assembly protein FimT
LLIVVGIIGILLAVAVPAIARFIKVYRIQAAAQQVAGEIANARAKAISKNTNLGVLFMVLDPNTAGNPSNGVAYRYVLEDNINGGTGARQATTALLANTAQLGPLRWLPQSVVFTTPTAGANNNSGMRFTGMGAMCNPSGAAEPCPALNYPGTSYVYWDPASQQGLVTLMQQDTNLKAQVSVQSGGRVAIARSWTVQ